MTEDNVPLNAAAIGFGAYRKEYEILVDNLIAKGVHPSEACRTAKEMSGQFLHFTANAKFADNLGAADMTFVAEEDCE